MALVLLEDVARAYARSTINIFASCRIMPTVLMLVYSFWIPQIVHCARTDVKQPLRPLYVLGMSFTRLSLLLYFYGCPSNVMKQPPNPLFCVILVGWLSLQVQ